MQNPTCGGKITPHINMNTTSPPWNTVVAASNCEFAFFPRDSKGAYKYRKITEENLLDASKYLGIDLKLGTTMTLKIKPVLQE